MEIALRINVQTNFVNVQNDSNLNFRVKTIICECRTKWFKSGLKIKLKAIGF